MCIHFSLYTSLTWSIRWFWQWCTHSVLTWSAINLMSWNLSSQRNWISPLLMHSISLKIPNVSTPDTANRPLGIIRFYLRSEQFWDIELQRFCIPYRKMCMRNKFLSNIKITGTLNVQNTSHNVNKLSQNKNMWITQFWQTCQIEPYNSKGTKWMLLFQFTSLHTADIMHPYTLMCGLLWNVKTLCCCI